MFKHIILATDGSPSAQKACETAIALAKVHGAKITAAFVVDPYPYMSLGEDSASAFQAYMNAAHASSAKVTGKLAEQAKESGVHLDTLVIEGDGVATSILTAAKDVGADLLVLGSHGRTGIERLILGSVASKVLSMSTVPVLIVR